MEIDYDFELMMFKSKTNLEDDNTAYEYLNKNDWDSEKASAAYFKTLDSNISKVETKVQPKNNNSNLNNKKSFEEINSKQDNFFSNSEAKSSKNTGNDFHRELGDILPLPKESNFDTVSNFLI